MSENNFSRFIFDQARSHLTWVLGEAERYTEAGDYARASGALKQAGRNMIRATDESVGECWCDLADPRIVGHAPCRAHNRCPVCGDSWATHSDGYVDGVLEDCFTCGAGHAWEATERPESWARREVEAR